VPTPDRSRLPIEPQGDDGGLQLSQPIAALAIPGDGFPPDRAPQRRLDAVLRQVQARFQARHQAAQLRRQRPAALLQPGAMAINFSAGLGQGLGIGQAIEQQPLVSGLQVQVVGALGRCGRGGEG
jgi:hypothetical protein